MFAFCVVTVNDEHTKTRFTKKHKGYIVGKGVHTAPFSKIPPFLEIQDVPSFYRPIGKTKVLKDFFNQFVYNFYPQSILILDGYLRKWQNTNLI